MGRSTPVIVIAMIITMAILTALGTWQLNRMKWKEDLIAHTKARLAGELVSLTQIEDRWRQTGDVDYMPVIVEGRFDHQMEMYFYNTLNGQTGWNVITPLHLGDGRAILLNRGFVPDRYRDKNKRLPGQIKGVVSIKGLARNPVNTKPNRYIPENQIAKREFFWKSHHQMTSVASDASQVEILPFLVDAGASDIEGTFPLGGTTRILFSNNHLQYALTWYGLALALLAVGSVFIYGRRKQSA